MLFPNSKRMVQAAALVAVLTIGPSGCVPTWLPDSSGFLYVKHKPNPATGTKDGQLLHFDLKTKKSRVVVENVGADTMWPAVSPDGKRVAVARFIGDPDKVQTIQMVLYDLQGKELHKSEEHAWTLGENKGGLPAMLFWSPKDDMVVVTDLNRTAFYDVKGDKFKVFNNACPVICGGTPIRPDGKGVLLVKVDKEKAQLFFVDWKGVGQEIDGTALVTAIREAKKGNAGEPMEELVGLASFGLIFPSGWQGNEAWMGNKRDKATITIDLANKKVALTEQFKALLNKVGAANKMPTIQFDFTGDVSIHIMRVADDSPEKKGGEFMRIVAVNRKTGKENVLEAKVSSFPPFLTPSPDGNYVTLSSTTINPGDDSPFILVLNKKGEVVSKIALEQ